MIKRWIIYIATIIGAITFYGVYDGYISYFILITVILFPFFSLAISLFSMLRIKFNLVPLPIEIRKSEVVSARININPRTWLPISQVNITYTANNVTLGRNSSLVTVMIFGSYKSYVSLQLNTEHVGCINLDIKKIRVFDYLGLFSLSLKTPEKRRILIMPKIERPDPMPILPIDKVGSKGLKPKPGGGFSEDYDLREYRIGDPLNAIHWKLTSKFDKIIVKEPLVSEKGKIFICFNLFGNAEEVDNIFGQISYIAHIFLRRMIEFNLCWYGKEGNLNVFNINEISDYLNFIGSVFNNPIELKGNAIDNKAFKDADWHYVISPNLPEKGDALNG
ncbi:MAG: hypothetical protein A2Y15_03210 [Clostridiales bacterium GWF2_36_10]|nr:MAG: hypothetical protein A2Y15_03210 [Clostridiales bacterium GWF2_36_10]